MDLERLGGEIREAGERPFPAERLHDEVLVHSADAGRIHLSPGRDAKRAEVDTLGRQPGFTCVAGAGGLVHEIVALLLEVARHLARERLHDPQRHQRRRIALVAARRALSVAVEERVVGLGAGAGRTADPVARGARDGLRTTEQPFVDASKRSD